jgi:hypothetical protein
MTIQHLVTRLKRLEQHAQTQEEGVLHVWRLPDESVEEACDRYEIDPQAIPKVRVHIWLGGRALSRLATPPAPLWVSQTLPIIADLERQLHEGLKQRWLPL